MMGASSAARSSVGEVHLLFFRGQFQVGGFLGGEVLHHLGELFVALDVAVELRRWPR